MATCKRTSRCRLSWALSSARCRCTLSFSWASSASFAFRVASSRAPAMRKAAISETVATPTRSMATVASKLATVGFRRHQRPKRSTGLTGRAWTGSSPTKRCRSAASAPADW